MYSLFLFFLAFAHCSVASHSLKRAQEPHAVVVATKEDNTLSLAALPWSSVKSLSSGHAMDLIGLDTIHNCGSPRLWLGAFPQDGGGGSNGHFYFDVFTSFDPVGAPSDGFALDLRRFSCCANDVKLHDKQRVIHNGQGRLVTIVSGNDDSISRCVVVEQLQSDMQQDDRDAVVCTQSVLHHTSCALKESARDALCCLLQRWGSLIDDDNCEFVKHLKDKVATEPNILDAVKRVAHVDTCVQPASFDQKNLKNALELLYRRSEQLQHLWQYLLALFSEGRASYATSMDNLKQSVFYEIEIAHQGLAACHRIISACSSVKILQCNKTTAHPFLDGPHPHPIADTFYTRDGVFHQYALAIHGCSFDNDLDTVMFFVENPASSELLNHFAWSLYERLDKMQSSSLVHGLDCCNFAACVYGSLGNSVPSVGYRRERDSVSPEMKLTLPIGSTCAALCFEFECSLVRGSCKVTTKGVGLAIGMRVSGDYIQPGTTIKSLIRDGSATFELSIVHAMQQRDSISTRLLFTYDESWVRQQEKQCFDTLFAQVTFLKNIFTTDQAVLLQSWSREPHQATPFNMLSSPPQTLLQVARTALVNCTSALVELAPMDSVEGAMRLEEDVMQGLYNLIRTRFDEEIFGVMLDISCNAYHRALNGGARLSVGQNNVIVRVLSLFNYVDVHNDVLADLRRDTFTRCLSSSHKRYSQVLPFSQTLSEETRILQDYIRICLFPDVKIPNPFGTPLPQDALEPVGPPCVSHSYQAHSCLIILCDLAHHLHSRRSKEKNVNAMVPRLILDLFLFCLHVPEGKGLSRADDLLLLHAPLSHELCYLGWRLCCWLTCGRLPKPGHVTGVSPELNGEDSMLGGVADTSSGNSKSGHMSILEALPINDMNRMYWNASDSKNREVRKLVARAAAALTRYTGGNPACSSTFFEWSSRAGRGERDALARCGWESS